MGLVLPGSIGGDWGEAHGGLVPSKYPTISIEARPNLLMYSAVSD